MSLRWFRRLDTYRKFLPVGEHEIRIEITRDYGYLFNYYLDRIYQQGDDEPPFYERLDHIVKYFDSSCSCEMYKDRLLKKLCFSVDDLKSRIYYFGRQNSCYEKEN